MCEANHRRLTTGISLALAASILLASCLTPAPACAQVPAAANRYRGDLVRSARLAWGLDAPIATMGAQVQQESAWRPDARSAYAHGLCQFTPATAAWIGSVDAGLASADTGNAIWCLRALARYDKWLWDRMPTATTSCDRGAFMLLGYNGGLGWVQRERARAAATGLDPGRYWQNVELTCLRNAAACAESRGYPRRILRVLEPEYVKAGWGRGLCP